jgi:hypothetical protein
MDPERRRVSRHILSGIAEISATQPNMQIVAPIGELSRFGCLVKTSVSIAIGTKISLTIVHEGQQFTAPANVEYVAPEKGLGVVFSQVSARDAALLEDWLKQSDWLLGSWQFARKTRKVGWSNSCPPRDATRCKFSRMHFAFHNSEAKPVANFPPVERHVMTNIFVKPHFNITAIERDEAC